MARRQAGFARPVKTQNVVRKEMKQKRKRFLFDGSGKDHQFSKIATRSNKEYWSNNSIDQRLGE
jgi:hypothetical protein